MTSAANESQLPAGQTSIAVKLINPVNFGPAQIHRFMAPAVPGLETFPTSPSLCFLLEHPSGRRLVWDLGIRQDLDYSPSIAEYLPTTKYTIHAENSVAEILEHNGVSRESIEAVIWSHWHWDHIGDPSTFPHTTNLVVGPGFKDAMLPGAPSNPQSPLKESDYEYISSRTVVAHKTFALTLGRGRHLREISFDGGDTLQIGRFKAFDYFGDGSFYLLDSPGHAVGHLCGLARTTTSPSTFILLGGDVCHYAGIFRPSQYLSMPNSISPHPLDRASREAFCPGHAWEALQTSRGRNSKDSLYDMTFGHDIPLANETKTKLQELDCNEAVFVIIAHDSAVRDRVPHFPSSLNEWKANGWGHDLKWAFLRDLEAYWSSKDAT